MIIVYFESKTHAEIAAIFSNEEMYNNHLPILKLEAAAAGMKITESVKETDINVLENIERKLIGAHEDLETSITWTRNDFEQRAIMNGNPQDYDNTMFSEALKLMIEEHDAECGITWNDVDTYLNDYCKK